MSGTLYIVATPIGNLGDITLRALETLKTVDFIAAEDTRVTRGLLTHFDIHQPLMSYHEHNRAESGEKIVARLLAGECCALVSDAGTPIVSDPGHDLILQCRAAGVPVVAVPGACAMVAAISIAGMDATRFCFEGFLSTNKRARREHLGAIRDERRTMVFYEAPHKLQQTLADLHGALGDREIALCRELTKLHEECRRTTLDEAARYYEEHKPRGEFVLIIAGADAEEEDGHSLADAVTIATALMAEGLRTKDAARAAAERTGQSKNEIYQALMGEKD